MVELDDDEALGLFVEGGTRRLMAFLAVVELERLATKAIVELVNAMTIKIIGSITTRTRVTSKNAAIAERDRFSRHRFINGLNIIHTIYLTKNRRGVFCVESTKTFECSHRKFL